MHPLTENIFTSAISWEVTKHEPQWLYIAQMANTIYLNFELMLNMLFFLGVYQRLYYDLHW